MNKLWTIMPGRNRTLYSDDETFYISFQPFPNNPFGDADTNDGETAICTGGKYYILNGDFRKEYEHLIDQGLDACLAFYSNHQHLWSSWSNEIEPPTQKGKVK